MKPYIDFFATFQGEFLGGKRFKNRMYRYWGTEYVDGIEVFKDRLYVYPEFGKNQEKVTKAIGAYQSIRNADFSSVAAYYLYLNSDKWTGQNELVEEILIQKIEAATPLEEEFEVNINYTESTETNMYAGWTGQQIYTYTTANWATIFDNIYIEARSDNIGREVVGMYVLFDDGSIFETALKTAGVYPKKNTFVGDVTPWIFRQDKWITTISLTLTCKRIADVTVGSAFFQGIKREKSEAKDRALRELQSNKNWHSEDGVVGIKRDTKTDDFWYKGQLRASTMSLSGKDFGKLFTRSLDTGFEKKKTKWWKKVLGPVILIIGILLIPTGAGLAVIAAYLAVTTIVMIAVQYAFAKSGDAGAAEYMGRWVKVANILSIATGIVAIAQSIAKQGLMQTVKSAFTSAATSTGTGTISQVASTTMTAEATALGLAGDTVTQVSVQSVGEVSVTKSLSLGSKIVGELMKFRNSMLAAKMDATYNSELKAVRQSEDELAEMYDKELNIGVEDIVMSTNPIKMDNVQFEVDYLYESTKYNIGRPSFVPIGLNQIS